MLHGALLSYKYHLENVTIIPTPNGAVPCCSQDHVRRLEHTEIARPKNGELTTLCGRPLQFEVERQRACHGGERMFQSLFLSTLYRFNRQHLRTVTRWRHGSPYSNRDRDQANNFCLAKSPKMDGNDGKLQRSARLYERRGRTGNLSCSFLHRSSSGTIVAPLARTPISLAYFFANTSDASTRLSFPPSRKCLQRCHRRRRSEANKTALSAPHPL